MSCGGGSCDFQPSFRGGSLSFVPNGRGGSCVEMSCVEMGGNTPWGTPAIRTNIQGHGS